MKLGLRYSSSSHSSHGQSPAEKKPSKIQICTSSRDGALPYIHKESADSLDKIDLPSTVCATAVQRRSPCYNGSSCCTAVLVEQRYCCTLSATNLYPFFSKRAMISPTRLRCTPSGLIMMYVRSMVLHASRKTGAAAGTNHVTYDTSYTAVGQRRQPVVRIAEQSDPFRVNLRLARF